MTHRKKILWGMVAISLSMFFVFLFWREWRYRSIPDIGPPFDVEAFLAKYQNVEENAFDIYRETLPAMKKAQELNEKISHSIIYEVELGQWEKAPQETKDYLERMQSVLDAWQRGSQLPVAFEVNPSEVNFESLLPLTQESREITRLLMLETVRLLDQEKTEEAWERYKQLLRMSVQMRDGFIISHLVGVAEYNIFTKQFADFIALESLTVEQLLEIKNELSRNHEKIPSYNEALKFEYMGWINTFEDRTSSQSWLNSLTNEEKVFKRVVNLLYANWMDGFSKSPRERAKIQEHQCNSGWLKYQIFYNGSRGCRYSYFENAKYAEELQNSFHKPSSSQGFLIEFIPAIEQAELVFQRDRLRQQVNMTAIGLQIYYRKHGRFPTTLESLVPNYVEELPREPGKKGAVLNYNHNSAGVTLESSDAEYVFFVYKPGADKNPYADLIP